MSAFEDLIFDAVQCLAELNEFAQLLTSRSELSEREHILPFFRTRRHLSALLGSYSPDIITFDRLAYEIVTGST